MKIRLVEYPETVNIDGREYAINTDFSVWIEIEQQMLKRKRSSGEGLARVFTLAYPNLPDSFMDAVRGIIWFYSEGSDGQSEYSKERTVTVCDLKADFEYIRAGFLSEFGIDLMKCDMHWWQFRRMLSCLGEDCKFSKIVSYRCTDTSRIKNRELKKFYERMKKRYKLPDERTPEEKEADIAQMLESLF